MGYYLIYITIRIFLDLYYNSHINEPILPHADLATLAGNELLAHRCSFGMFPLLYLKVTPSLQNMHWRSAAHVLTAKTASLHVKL